MLEVVPLGGLGEFGMNMLALSWGEATIVVDAGVMFPDPELLGVDRKTVQRDWDAARAFLLVAMSDDTTCES